jgi:hypothetical protein
MTRFPWTKLQDFYLRLGFLKVLVAASSPERRSIFADALIRRLEVPLFVPARNCVDLWNHVGQNISWYENDHKKGKKLDQPSVAEALLVLSGHPSYLYAITKKSAFKIVDWGRDVELLGAGHQITERGLLTRGLIPVSKAEQFFDGDVMAWNPFAMDLREKLLFFYHISEMDHVMLELASDFGDWNIARPMESAEVARFMCNAMLRVVGSAQGHIRNVDVPAYRVASDLARTIAFELGMQTEYQKSKLGGSQPSASFVPRLPPTKKFVGSKPGMISTGFGHKNADHQTVPRVEQLVDLGFLYKPNVDKPGAARESNRRWRYAPTEVSRRWRAARRTSDPENENFLKDGFARTAVFAFHRQELPASVGELMLVAKHLWSAYLQIGRRHGNSPLDSIALYAMVTAAAEGVAIEMASFERLMNAIKRVSALPEHVFFAGGNDLDTMFLRLKPGFLEALELNRTSIESAYFASTQ